MTKRFFQEYGLIVALAIVGVVSLIFYRSIDRFNLEQALDNIGAQLLNVVEDAAEKQNVRDLYAAFKQRVLNNEVSPEQVELLTMNVLNLSNSGETLTEEEAKAVLELSFGGASSIAASLDEPVESAAIEPEETPEIPEPAEEVEVTVRALEVSDAASVAPKNAAPVPGVERSDLTHLGKRLHVLLDFDKAVDEVRASGTGDFMVVSRRHLDNMGGAQIVIDVKMRDEMSRVTTVDMEDLLVELETANLVKWEGDLAEVRELRELERERAIKCLNEIRAGVEDSNREARLALQEMERYHRLQSKGVVMSLDLDSLEQVVQHIIMREKRHERAVQKPSER